MEEYSFDSLIPVDDKEEIESFSSSDLKPFEEQPTNALNPNFKMPETSLAEDVGSWVKTTAKGVAHGSLGLGETVGIGAEYLGHRIENKELVRAGKTASEYWGEKAEKYGQPASLEGKNVWDNPEILANAEYWLYNIGDMAPTLAASIIPGAGASKVLSAVKVAPKLALLGGSIVGGGFGGSIEGAQTYKSVLAEGGSEKEAARAGELMAVGSGVLNALSVGKVLDKAGAGFKGRVIKTLGAAAWEGITEGAEEPTEVFAKYLSKYLNDEPLPDNLVEQLIQSGKDALTVMPVAVVMGGGGAAISGDGVIPDSEVKSTKPIKPSRPARENAEKQVSNLTGVPYVNKDMVAEEIDLTAKTILSDIENGAYATPENDAILAQFFKDNPQVESRVRELSTETESGGVPGVPPSPSNLPAPGTPSTLTEEKQAEHQVLRQRIAQVEKQTPTNKAGEERKQKILGELNARLEALGPVNRVAEAQEEAQIRIAGADLTETRPPEAVVAPESADLTEGVVTQPIIETAAPERLEWHTDNTGKVQKKYINRNDSIRHLVDSKTIIDDILSETKDPKRRARIEKSLRDKMLRDYDVVQDTEIESVQDSFEEQGIPYVLEFGDGENLGGANEHAGTHADADILMQKLWGDVYAREAQKYGAIVGKKAGGDEFKLVWPNFTKAEVQEIRADISDQLANQKKIMGVERVPHPKHAGMPVGIGGVNSGFSEWSKENPVSRGELERKADIESVVANNEKLVDIAEREGYDHIEDEKGKINVIGKKAKKVGDKTESTVEGTDEVPVDTDGRPGDVTEDTESDTADREDREPVIPAPKKAAPKKANPKVESTLTTDEVNSLEGITIQMSAPIEGTKKTSTVNIDAKKAYNENWEQQEAYERLKKCVRGY